MFSSTEQSKADLKTLENSLEGPKNILIFLINFYRVSSVISEF
jgi:hypothetical protein